MNSGMSAELPEHCAGADVCRLSVLVFADYAGLTQLYAMARYCEEHHQCRRKIIAEYFGY